MSMLITDMGYPQTHLFRVFGVHPAPKDNTSFISARKAYYT